MTKESFDPKLTTGFNYILKNCEMILNFICDCCNHEIKVTKKYLEESAGLDNSIQKTFNDLKKEMDRRFYRCKKCGFLICPECWKNREKKCPNCNRCKV